MNIKLNIKFKIRSRTIQWIVVGALLIGGGGDPAPQVPATCPIPVTTADEGGGAGAAREWRGNSGRFARPPAAHVRARAPGKIGSCALQAAPSIRIRTGQSPAGDFRRFWPPIGELEAQHALENGLGSDLRRLPAVEAALRGDQVVRANVTAQGVVRRDTVDVDLGGRGAGESIAR